MEQIRLNVNYAPYRRGIIKPYQGEHREECSICIDNDEFTYKNWIELACKHCFHQHCIDLWLEKHNTCPLCTIDVDIYFLNQDNDNRQKERCSNCICFLCIIFIIAINILVWHLLKPQ